MLMKDDASPQIILKTDPPRNENSALNITLLPVFHERQPAVPHPVNHRAIDALKVVHSHLLKWVSQTATAIIPTAQPKNPINPHFEISNRIFVQKSARSLAALILAS